MEFLKYKNFEYVFKAPEKAEGKLPVIIFLHGAGTRDTDCACLARNSFFGQNSLFANGENAALLFAPLCRHNSWFDVFEQLQDFVKFALSHPNADVERLYLVGNSMGGYGVWQLATTMSEYVAAVIPVCGGGMTWNYKPLLHIPIWAVHGLEDRTVPPENSIRYVEKINKHEGNAKITLLEGVGHNSWNYTYACREIYDWLFAQKRQNKTNDGINEYADSKKFG